jgi:hypothetical protein
MNESTPEFLTVSQAAAALGISERQARRYAGRLAPDDRREGGHKTGHSNAARPALVRLDAMRALRESAVSRPTSGEITPDKVPDIPADTRPPEAGHDAGHSGGHATGALVSQLQSENAFLRSALEARDRDAAELRAALREALKISNRAIMPPTDGSAQNAPESAPTAPTTANTSRAKIAAPGGTGREARPLWKVILGVR